MGARPLFTQSVTQRAEEVLVVDPDPTVRALLGARLARAGFEVTPLTSVREARARLTGPQLPSALVCEAVLPDGDGFELCGHLRSDQRTAQLPVVLLARAPQAEHVALARASGADEYLAKPVFASDVVTWVRLKALAAPLDGEASTTTAQLPLFEAVRALLTGMGEGTLTLESGGSLRFGHGRILAAAWEGCSGEAALERVVLLGRGAYSVRPGAGPAEGQLSLGLKAYVARMNPRVRRMRSLVAQGVPLDAVRVVDFRALAHALATLPERINQVLRLFDGRRTVEQTLSESALAPVTMLQAVNQLVAQGVLVPVERSAATLATLERQSRPVHAPPEGASGADGAAFLEPERAGLRKATLGSLSDSWDAELSQVAPDRVWEALAGEVRGAAPKLRSVPRVRDDAEGDAGADGLLASLLDTADDPPPAPPPSK